MYLIHARLGVPPGVELPPETASLFSDCALPGEGLEHLVLHQDPRGGVVVGFFMTADDLDRAEAVAATICRRGLSDARLSGWTLLRCESPLVTRHYEHMLGPESPPGRDRTRPEPA